MRISPVLQSQITWLCNKIHEKEWSGILFWNLESGSFENGDAKIVGEYLYLLDIGTGTYTEFDQVEGGTDMELVSFFCKNPHYATMYRGKIHSHNSMSVFHSETDKTDLKEQTVEDFYNYYVSLIVNNANNFDLAVSFKAQVSTPTTVYIQKDLAGKQLTRTINTPETKDVVYYYNGVVETEEIIDQVMQNCYNKLLAKIPVPVNSTTTSKKTTSDTVHDSDAWSKWAKASYPSLWDGFDAEDEYEYSVEAFLKAVLPSTRRTVEDMLEDMENIISEDSTNTTYNKLYDMLDSTLIGYTEVDLDIKEGQDLLNRALSYLNGLNLIYPNAVELSTGLIGFYLMMEDEKEGEKEWKQLVKK